MHICNLFALVHSLCSNDAPALLRFAVLLFHLDAGRTKPEGTIVRAHLRVPFALQNVNPLFAANLDTVLKIHYRSIGECWARQVAAA